MAYLKCHETGNGKRQCDYICSQTANCDGSNAGRYTLCHVNYDKSPILFKNHIPGDCAENSCHLSLGKVCNGHSCTETCEDLKNLHDNSLIVDEMLQCSANRTSKEHFGFVVN